MSKGVGRRGSSGVSHRPQQGTEKRGAEWREVVEWGCGGVTPPNFLGTQWGSERGRELRSNLGVKWEMLHPGKGCQAFTVSHGYRKGSELAVQSWRSSLFKGTHFPRRSSCRHTHRTRGEHLTISCVSSGKCRDVSVSQSPVCKVRVGIGADLQGCGRW